MNPILLKIPGIESIHETHWKIYALAFVKGVGTPVQSEVFDTLAQWAIAERSEYSRIINSMRRACMTKRGQVIDRKFVSKCDNSDYGEIYEFRANAGKARVMFFYFAPNLIICTNTFWKTSARVNQDAAFRKCGVAQSFFIKSHQHHSPKTYNASVTDSGCILLGE